MLITQIELQFLPETQTVFKYHKTNRTEEFSAGHTL